MKVFKFRLQAALEHRKSIEEQLLMELSALRLALEEAVRELERMNDELGSRRLLLEKSLRTGKVSEALVADAYIQDLRERIEVQRLDIETARARVDAKMAEAVAASQARKAIEKLKEKQHEEYRKEIEREEQREMDDIASVRFSRAMA